MPGQNLVRAYSQNNTLRSLERPTGVYLMIERLSVDDIALLLSVISKDNLSKVELCLQKIISTSKSPTVLNEYLKTLTDARLGWLYYKTDIQFWNWVNRHYSNPTDKTAYQVERWRRLNYMIHDEMYSVDRIKRNAQTLPNK